MGAANPCWKSQGRPGQQHHAVVGHLPGRPKGCKTCTESARVAKLLARAARTCRKHRNTRTLVRTLVRIRAYCGGATLTARCNTSDMLANDPTCNTLIHFCLPCFGLALTEGEIRSLFVDTCNAVCRTQKLGSLLSQNNDDQLSGCYTAKLSNDADRYWVRYDLCLLIHPRRAGLWLH